MSFLYIWRTTQLSPSPAREYFQRILTLQCEQYQRLLGHPFTWKIHQSGAVLIGQIQLLTDIGGWTQWAQSGDSGIAWSGICEDYLSTTFDTRQIREIVTTARKTPERIASWNGRFGLCTWSPDDIRLTTAATESPSFWYTEGPNGWAVGSRAAPILEMVGRQTSLNHDMASLYIAFGYLIGPDALLEHVTRLSSRQQVVLTTGDAPSPRTYITLSDYVGNGANTFSWQDAVGRCAQRLVTRVKHQLQHTPNPNLLLTSGRDSRCIAAAAAAQGYTGPAQTVGDEHSTEVEVAADVARTLHIHHEGIPLSSNDSPMRAVSLALAQQWTQMSEGMDMFLQAISFQGFFQRKLPFPPIRHQLLHGLGGEITRGFYYTNTTNHDLNARTQPAKAYAAIAKKIPFGLILRRPIEPLLMHVVQRMCDELGNSTTTLAQWLDTFYWQNRCLHWGSDMLSVREVLYWHWTPLLDRTFVQTGWNLSPTDKVSNRFIEAVTSTIAPSLKDVAYGTSSSAINTMIKQTAKRLLGIVDRYNGRLLVGLTIKPARVQADEHLLRFWDSLFFSYEDHAWTEFIEESTLRRFLDSNPSAEVLWNIATVELVAQTLCSGQGKSIAPPYSNSDMDTQN